MRRSRVVLAAAVALVGVGGLSAVVAIPASADSHGRGHQPHQVVVPEEDRFTPFAITIHAGDTVQWVNRDTDDHTVVSDDPLSSTGPRGVNQLLVGTEANNDQPGVITLKFTHPGVFVYYCRFHSHLDAANQPAAPGPEGGIQDSNGNFGTPMSGTVTVVGDQD